jgi:hypothetical protein
VVTVSVPVLGLGGGRGQAGKKHRDENGCRFYQFDLVCLERLAAAG